MAAVLPTTTFSPDRDVRGSAFAVLARQVRAAGLLDRRRGAYALRLLATLGFYAAAWTAVAWIGDSWWQCGGAVVLGLAYTRVAFLGHDAGHQQIFASRRANDHLGRFLGDALVGLSYGWWIGKHNRHH